MAIANVCAVATASSSWLDTASDDYDVKVMAATNRIVLDPAIHHGKPVIRGTRVPVTVVVGSLAGGMTFEEIQREYG